MKSISFFLGISLLSLLLFSCEVEDSEDVNQDRIYASYELFYNENTDKTLASARFRFGGPTGTILELSSPAEVTFNGDILDYNQILLAHTREYAGRLQGGTFEYTDVDGEFFSNTAPSYSDIAFPAGLDSISQSSSYALVWDGTALGADERVGVFAGSWTFGDDALFYTDTDGATEIVMGKAQLENLPLGPSTLYMDRSTQVPVSQGTEVGGVVTSKYRCTNKVVQIVN